jgi:hypothetical protein
MLILRVAGLLLRNPRVLEKLTVMGADETRHATLR